MDTHASAAPWNVERALLLCGVLAPIVYVGTDLVACLLYPGFSSTDQAVSELFAIGAPTSGLVVPLFTLSSALLLPFAFAIWRTAGDIRWMRTVAVMVAANAVNGLVLWNFFPMHMRGVAPTFTDTMHLVFAANPFVLLGIVFAALALRGPFRAYSVATIAVVVLLAVFSFRNAPQVGTNGPTPWMGLTERLAQYVHQIWQAVLAVLLVEGAPGHVEMSHPALGLPGNSRRSR
jgi:hypothetical membrane protein